jgi:hypothetical protein
MVVRHAWVACLIWHFALPIQVGMPLYITIPARNAQDRFHARADLHAVAKCAQSENQAGPDTPQTVDASDGQPSAEAGVAFEQRGKAVGHCNRSYRALSHMGK